MRNKSYIPILAVLGAIILAVVAAMAPPQSFLGRDFVHAQTTDDATLSDLSLGNDAASEAIIPSGTFMADTMTYSVRAANATDKVTVTATPNNPSANVVRITPSDQDRVLDGHQVLIYDGRNRVITVMVRSEGGGTTETYIVTVYQERSPKSDDADLSALRLSGVTLSPSFASASANITYTGRAAYSTNETTVTATADIGATSVEIMPNDVPDSADGHQVALGEGVITSITVAVIAEAGGTATKTYTVNVYRENRVKSDNADLSDLELTGIGGTVTFEYDDAADASKSYPNVRVENGVDTVTVAATPANLGAKATISPSDEDSETDLHQVLLAAGEKTDITVRVIAEDGRTTETYSVTIYRERRVPSDDADLSALRLSGVTLSPSFASASANITYTGRAAYSTNETTVTATADIGATSVEIMPNDVPDSASGHQVALGEGVITSITVAVIAEAGSAATKTYTVNVYRENRVKSDNADLSDLELTGIGGTVTFEYAAAAAASKSYPNVRVENGVDAVTVAATPANLGAKATISPSDEDSVTDLHQVLLAAGEKTDITVEVIAEDGRTTETYSVTIYRERRVPSVDADLSALRLSGVTISPSFDSANITYTGRAAYSTNETTVTATADIGATSVEIMPNDVPDSASGHQVALGEGVITSITVAVIAEAGSAATKTYTVNVYRENRVKSDNADLSDLELTGIGGTVTFEYDAAADASKSYPNVRVENGVDAVTVAATPANLGAKATISPSDEDSVTDLHQAYLGVGEKTDITVEVIAEDGRTTETYSVTIYRERRVPSVDADLSALRLSGVTISPSFDSANITYTGRAAYSTDETTVTATADIGATSVEIMPNDVPDSASGHQVALGEGVITSITVAVIAEAGSAATKTYTVNVYRENLPLSDDASLSDLELTGIGGTVTFEYDDDDAASKSYPNVRVENGVDAVTVAATPANLGAKATISPSDEDSVTDLHQVLLAAGGKTDITVEVIAEDGSTTETYSVTIYRERRVPSVDADLSALRLSGVTISPAVRL